MRPFELRVEPHRVFQHLDRLGGAPELEQHESQVLLRLRETRRHLDGPAQYLLRIRVAPELDVDRTQQSDDVHVARMRIEHLAAAPLGLPETPVVDEFEYFVEARPAA